MILGDSIRTQLEAIKGGPIELHIPLSATAHQFIVTCPNPEHVDHHPSCVGDLLTGKYKCLGCGFSGQLEF